MSSSKLLKFLKHNKFLYLGVFIGILIGTFFLLQYRQYTDLLQSDIEKIEVLLNKLFHASINGEVDHSNAFLKVDMLQFLENSILYESLSGDLLFSNILDKFFLESIFDYLLELRQSYLQQLNLHLRLYSFFLWSFLTIITTFIALSFLSAFTNRNSIRNREYRDNVNENMLDILEKDRNIISYELHDDLAQKLAQISQFFNHPDFEEESFALLKKYSEESIQQVRLVSNRLKTPALSKLNVQDSYEQLFSDYKILTGINLDYKIIGMKNLQMAESRVIHIFRIVQELLNNAIKHSQSEQVQISIIYSHPEIIVKYKDNGIGYDYKKSMNTGLGLSSIQFRMNMLEARWTQMDTQSNGVTLIFKVPVKNEEYITN
ncbi:hypothetical protein DV872_04155 [Oceanispirochaeta sp. M1]|nr:hypothetical protein DV872_04155 [Oceanispirochaeta sp. M1]